MASSQSDGSGASHAGPGITSASGTGTEAGAPSWNAMQPSAPMEEEYESNGSKWKITHAGGSEDAFVVGPRVPTDSPSGGKGPIGHGERSFDRSGTRYSASQSDASASGRASLGLPPPAWTEQVLGGFRGLRARIEAVRGGWSQAGAGVTSEGATGVDLGVWMSHSSSSGKGARKSSVRIDRALWGRRLGMGAPPGALGAPAGAGAAGDAGSGASGKGTSEGAGGNAASKGDEASTQPLQQQLGMDAGDEGDEDEDEDEDELDDLGANAGAVAGAPKTDRSSKPEVADVAKPESHFLGRLGHHEAQSLSAFALD